MDKRQSFFDNFTVPDSGRIIKVTKLALDYVTKTFLLNQKLKILEVGYSKGGFIEGLLLNYPPERFEFYASDINERVVPVSINFKRCDLNKDFPFNDKFDIIFAGELIEHLFDDYKFLKDCYEHLKYKGILLITTPNLFFLLNRIVMFFGKIPYFAYAPFHYHFYSVKVIKRMFEETGFKVLKIKGSHILISSRRNRIIGQFFEGLGNLFPSLSAHIIIMGIK